MIEYFNYCGEGKYPYSAKLDGVWVDFNENVTKAFNQETHEEVELSKKQWKEILKKHEA